MSVRCFMLRNGNSGLPGLKLFPLFDTGIFACLEYDISKTMHTIQMKYEILIAGNDRKSKVHKPLPNKSCFGVYSDSHYIDCMDDHHTNTEMADHFYALQ